MSGRNFMAVLLSTGTALAMNALVVAAADTPENCEKLHSADYERFLKECPNFNRDLYESIASKEAKAKEEMDPASPLFCQGKPVNERECPSLEKLRWLIYNQFEPPFIEEEDLPARSKKFSPLNIKKAAFAALDRVTEMNINRLEDIAPFQPLLATGETQDWAILELVTNTSIYSAPVVYQLLFDKQNKVVSKTKLLPFVSDSVARDNIDGFNYNLDDRHLRWVTDIAILPGTSIGVARKDGECCGNVKIFFHFFDLKNDFKPMGALIFDNDPWVERQSLSTIERLKDGLGKLPREFPLVSKNGVFKKGQLAIPYRIQSPEKESLDK